MDRKPGLSPNLRRALPKILLAGAGMWVGAYLTVRFLFPWLWSL